MSMVPDDVYETLLAKPDVGPLKPLAEVVDEDPEPVVADPPAEEPVVEPEVEVDPDAEPETPAEPVVETPAEPEKAPRDPDVPQEPVAIDVDALADRVADRLRPVPEPEKPAERPIPAHLKALLDSADEGTKAYAQIALNDYNAQEDRLAAIESRFAQQDFVATVAAIDADIAKLKTNFALEVEERVLGTDGSPVLDAAGQPTVKVAYQDLTDAQIDEQVSKWADEHPEAAPHLTVREIAQRVWPNLARKPRPAAAPASPARPVIKVPSKPSGAVQLAPSRVAAAARTPAARHAAPPANETMDQAVARGIREIGFSRS